MLLLKPAKYIFGEKQKIQKFKKLKLSAQHDETCDLTSFVSNSAAPKLKYISKLFCASLFFPQHFKKFVPQL